MYYLIVKRMLINNNIISTYKVRIFSTYKWRRGARESVSALINNASTLLVQQLSKILQGKIFFLNLIICFYNQGTPNELVMVGGSFIWERFQNSCKWVRRKGIHNWEIGRVG